MKGKVLLVICVAALALEGCQLSESDKTKKLAEEYTSAWNSQTPKKVAAFYSDQAMLVINGDTIQGQLSITNFAKAFMRNFPDMELTMDSLVADSVGYRYHWSFTGTYEGILGSGNKVVFSGFERWTLNDQGRIFRAVGNYDEQSLRSQMNAKKGEIPDNYRIAFVSYRSGSGEVYLMKPDGSELKQLTDSEHNNSFPRDLGQQKLFFRKSDLEDQRNFSNYTLDLTTNEIEPYDPDPIIDGAMGEESSPDGRYISYSMSNNGRTDLYLFDRTTQVHTKLTTNEADSIDQQQYHIWTSDSKKIAFLGGPDWYSQFIRVYNIETKELKNITKRGYMCAGLIWLKSNDSFIANFKIRNETTYELWSVDEGSGEMAQLTDHPGRGSVHPKISPDGEWIVFESGRDGDDGEIYLMLPDGSEQTRITYDKSYDGRPEWVVL